MFCIINITMNILLQDKTWRCRYKCLNWHEIRHNIQSLWFFNIIFTSHHINFYGILPSHPCHCWLLCHQIETRDSPTNAATYSTLLISASDCKVRYLILLFFLQQTIFILSNLCPSHHCHLWFNLEMLLPKPNGSDQINGSPLFQEDNFVWFFHSTLN